MSNKLEATMHNRSILVKTISWLVGILFIAIGMINTFWGNDPGYGIFIVMLSLLYFPPVAAFSRRITGKSIPIIVKILLGIFIIWSALGVGELIEKIDLMLNDF